MQAQSGSPQKFKHGGKIVTTYDKAKDLTTVLLQSYQLKNAAGGPEDYVNAIDMTVGFTYPGSDQYGEPKVIEFVLEVSRVRPRSKKEPFSELIAEIKDQDQQIALGIPQLLGAGNDRLEGEVKGFGTIRIDTQFQRMGVLIPVDVFKKLAASRVVHLESGDVNVTLREKQLDAFRDLVSRIK